MDQRKRKQMDQLWSRSGKTTRQVGKKATKVAKQLGDYLSDRAEDVSDRAEDFRDEVRDRMRPRPSFRSRLGSFAAGLGLGFGTALLFAPRPGRQMRIDIKQTGAKAVDSFGRGYDRGMSEESRRRTAEL